MSGEKTLYQLFLAACEKGEEAKVNAAIVLGVDINTKDASGFTGLIFAIENKHERVVDILLAHPAIDINRKDKNSWSPLWAAARYGLTSVVAKLGRMPALRGVNDYTGGRTPLSYAIENGKDKQPAVGKKTRFRIFSALVFR